MSERENLRVTYGPSERFYDEDRHTTRMVKRRYETWWVNGEKVGRWDFVPASASEADATGTEDSLSRGRPA